MKKLFESWRKYVNEGEVIDFHTRKELTPNDIEKRLPYERAQQTLRSYIETFIESEEDEGPELDDASFESFVEEELKHFKEMAAIGRDFDKALKSMGYNPLLAQKDVWTLYADMKRAYDILKEA